MNSANKVQGSTGPSARVLCHGARRKASGCESALEQMREPLRRRRKKPRGGRERRGAARQLAVRIAEENGTPDSSAGALGGLSRSPQVAAAQRRVASDAERLDRKRRRTDARRRLARKGSARGSRGAGSSGAAARRRSGARLARRRSASGCSPAARGLREGKGNRTAPPNSRLRRLDKVAPHDPAGPMPVAQGP